MNDSHGCMGDEPTADVGNDSRLAMARWSYAEVLDATKHQDDKVGRFLTVIAFLTTGAIALLFQRSLVSTRWSLAHGQWPLLALADLAFVAFVLSAVSLLLLSLSAPLKLPGTPSRYGPPIEGSRLFFTYISGSAADEWERRWTEKDRPTITEQMYKNYVNETHNLAERASLKYKHTGQAGLWFSVGLSFLAASLALAVSAGLHTAPGPIKYSYFLGVALGLSFGGHGWLQIHAIVGDLGTSKMLKRDAKNGIPDAVTRLTAARAHGVARYSILVLALALTVPGDRALDRVLGASVALVTLGVTIWQARPRWFPWTGSGGTRAVRWQRFVQFFVIPAAVIVAAMVIGGIAPLLAAACLPVALALILNAKRVPLFHTPQSAPASQQN